MILVRLDTKSALVETEQAEEISTDQGFRIGGVGSRIYEIRSANLIYAEFISAKWRKTWKSLDAGLSEIASASRTTS